MLGTSCDFPALRQLGRSIVSNWTRWSLTGHVEYYYEQSTASIKRRRPRSPKSPERSAGGPWYKYRDGSKSDGEMPTSHCSPRRRRERRTGRPRTLPESHHTLPAPPVTGRACPSPRQPDGGSRRGADGIVKHGVRPTRLYQYDR